MNLLIVDDDAELRDLLLRALARDGHAVKACADLVTARRMLADHDPDLVVLDLSLPDGSGADLCRELRAEANLISILMLTVHSEVSVRVGSLDAGADDFLTKPFAVAELRARVRALGRRRMTTGRVFTQVTRTGLSLDLAARRAVVNGKTVELTAREWIVLEVLAAHSGRVVSRGQLLDSGWGENNSRAAASLEVLIGRIRRKLGNDLIRTLRGQGYSLECG